ncbi:MAG: hypothetical protein CL930_14265 [Deltaproteobacteria bacterium]|nr:hypothetical protein [Deltaproteobacteria bacterium]
MIRFALALMLSISTSALADDASWTHYGAEFARAETPVAAKALLDNPEPFVNKTITVQGRVADVCQKAGCWMVIAEGDKSMRIRMAKHAFSVAKDGAGSTCQIQGEVVARKVEPAQVAHFESESKNKEVMPEKKAVDGISYEMVATGVAFQAAK